MKNRKKLLSLLRGWMSGNDNSLSKLESALLDHLRTFTAQIPAPLQKGQTIQVANVLQQSLAEIDVGLSTRERAHLFSVASRQIRQVLTELNNNGSSLALSDEQTLLVNQPNGVDFSSLDRFLCELTRLDQQKATLFELSYFGGMNYEEMAEIVSMPAAVIDRELRFARAWMCCEIMGHG